MYFRVHDWPVLPSGQSYFGNQSDDNKPNGLGVITLEDDHHFYIGEFVNGKRQGRGFLLTHEEWDSIDSVWVRGSYEEVMATAEFGWFRCNFSPFLRRDDNDTISALIIGNLVLHLATFLFSALSSAAGLPLGLNHFGIKRFGHILPPAPRTQLFFCAAWAYHLLFQ